MEYHPTNQWFNWISGGMDASIQNYTNQITAKNNRDTAFSLNTPRSSASGSAEPFSGYNGLICIRGNTVSQADALHEILHIWRWYAEGIPYLAPDPNTRVQYLDHVIGRFENAIEHSIIVPLQGGAIFQRFETDILNYQINSSENIVDLGKYVVELSYVSLGCRNAVEAKFSPPDYATYKNIQRRLIGHEARTKKGKEAYMRELLASTNQNISNFAFMTA